MRVISYCASHMPNMEALLRQAIEKYNMIHCRQYLQGETTKCSYFVVRSREIILVGRWNWVSNLFWWDRLFITTGLLDGVVRMRKTWITPYRMASSCWQSLGWNRYRSTGPDIRPYSPGDTLLSLACSALAKQVQDPAGSVGSWYRTVMWHRIAGRVESVVSYLCNFPALNWFGISGPAREGTIHRYSEIHVWW